jgi:hypothetical protein
MRRVLGAFLALAGGLPLFGGMLAGGWGGFFALVLLPLWACLTGLGLFFLLWPSKVAKAPERPSGADAWAYDLELDGPDAEDL